MATEQSPLLGDQPCTSHIEDVYDRFSRQQKRVILAIVALTGLVPMFVSGCFVPSIPQISSDLGTTPAVVSLGVSLSVLASSLGVMFWSAYTSFYGRRMVYLCGMPITIIGSFAIAASTDIKSLLFWRFVQTFGCSGGYALGAATVGDIYKAEERGAAMGTFLGATLSGFAIAPPIGGAFTEFWSWRGFQVALGVWGAIQKQGLKGSFVLVNPFCCLTFLRSPNIIAIALANTSAFISDYTLLVPIAYTVGAKYGIASEGLLGVIFLPNGLGNVVGAQIAGRMSDVVVRRAKEERKGVWVPEDRLRAVWIGGLVLIPVSVTLAGFTTRYIGGMVGLVINLLCIFTNGMGVDMVLTPIGAYNVDVVPSRRAEVMAAVVALRSLLLAPVSALLIPSVETIGVAATNSISGILALIGYFLVWLTIRYGEQMRSYVDVGFSDFNTRALNGDNMARD